MRYAIVYLWYTTHICTANNSNPKANQMENTETQAAEKKPLEENTKPPVVNEGWLKNKMSATVKQDVLDSIAEVCPSDVTNISQFLRWILEAYKGSLRQIRELERQMEFLNAETIELSLEIQKLERANQPNNPVAPPTQPIATPAPTANNPVETTTKPPETTEKPKESMTFMQMMGF